MILFVAALFFVGVSFVGMYGMVADYRQMELLRSIVANMSDAQVVENTQRFINHHLFNVIGDSIVVLVSLIIAGLLTDWWADRRDRRQAERIREVKSLRYIDQIH